MAGSITLVEAGGTTTETVDVEITVNIPLVGGKIETLIADMLRKALRAEEQGRARLPVALRPSVVRSRPASWRRRTAIMTAASTTNGANARTSVSACS